MDEAYQAAWFERHFKCTLRYVDNQRVGTAKDYEITAVLEGSSLDSSDVGEFVEFKFDKACKKTGNLYLEYEQTFNGTRFIPSGMKLAINQSKYIVFSVKFVGCVHHYIFNRGDMREILTHKMRSVSTRPNANGNRDGCFTKGYLLPAHTVTAFRQIEQISDRT
jgi:hypothetical protein